VILGGVEQKGQAGEREITIYIQTPGEVRAAGNFINGDTPRAHRDVYDAYSVVPEVQYYQGPTCGKCNCRYVL
jgi:hypothetical protein